MVKRFIKVDEQGYFLDDELIKDLATVKDEEGNLIPEYVDPETDSIPPGIHRPKRENGAWVEGKVTTPEEKQLALDKAYEMKRAEVNEACRVEIEAGFDFLNPYDSKTYNVTTRESPDQTNWNSAMTTMSVDNTHIQYWYSSGNTKFYMDYVSLIKFGNQFAAHKETCQDKCAALKDQLALCTTVEGVEAISWNVGE